jgi:hypothetical protein
LCFIAARMMLRPMRPNPLIPTFTAIDVLPPTFVDARRTADTPPRRTA